MAIKIRRTDDLQAIHELDRLTFPGDHPTLDRDKTHTWWIAEHGDDPVGFIGFGLDKGVITRVGVAPAARGHGLQKRLVRVALRYAKRQGFPTVTTYAKVTNIPSLRSLVACGFKPTRTWTYGTQCFMDLEAALA